MVYVNNYQDKFYKVREIKTLKEMIDSNKELFGNNIAFLNKDKKAGAYKEITYSEFKEDVDALGTKLIDLGLENEKIAVIGENCYQWVASYFAVVNGVGTVVPLDKELSPLEIENLVKTANCKAIFYTEGYKKIVENIDVEYKFEMNKYLDDGTENFEGNTNESPWKFLVQEGKALIDNNDFRFINKEIDPEEVKMLLFTSGTTDVPKAVMLCHRNLITNILDVSRIVNVRQEDRTLSILPIHHTFESTIGIMVPLYNGSSIAFYEGLKYVAKNLAEAKATLLVGVPLIFESMYNKIWKQAEKSNKDKALKSVIKINKVLSKIGIDVEKKLFKSIYESFGGKLRMLVCGAAAINPNVIRGFKDFGIDMVIGYGLTETAPLLSGTPDFSDRYSKAGSVGPVVPSGQMKLVDIDEDGIGEIAFCGDNVMKGYLDMPDKTEAVLKDGWFYTGDLGFIDEKGWLYLTGRKKNVIVTKTGKNIYPEEIEKYLFDIPYIQECMVYGFDNKDTGETVVSVQIIPNYELIEEKFNFNNNEDKIYKLLKESINNDVNEKLVNYKRIRNIIIRKDEFVKTTTHKIKRNENI